MTDFENLDFEKININELIETFKNLGKELLNADEVTSKVQAGESLAGAKILDLDLSGIDFRGTNH